MLFSNSNRGLSPLVHGLASRIKTGSPPIIAAALAVVGIGFALGVTVTVRVVARADACWDLIGPAAQCASPRRYFPRGLFGETDCGFSQVVELHCVEEGKGFVLPKIGR